MSRPWPRLASSPAERGRSRPATQALSCGRRGGTGLWIRTDPDTDERQLIVANTYGGIRILAYNPIGVQQ